jgi:hypothetical protein
MLIKKITPSVINAYDETYEILERELSKLTDKIANDTITPDELRYYDHVKMLKADIAFKRTKFVIDNTPKNALDRLFTKLISPLIPN